MNTNLLFSVRRRMLVLATAALLAIAVSFAPVLLDGATGTSLTTSAFACGPSGGGC